MIAHKWLPVTFRSILFAYEEIDVVLHVSELFRHCLQHTFNVLVRGFVEVHVVAFFSVHETGVPTCTQSWIYS